MKKKILAGILAAVTACTCAVTVVACSKDKTPEEQVNVGIEQTAFGGGMKIAPMQDRFNEKGSLSIIVAHDLSKPKITALFLTIFKGEHIKFKKNVTVHTGNDVKVIFDRPCPMQIDGEPIDNIIEYSVTAKSLITK